MCRTFYHFTRTKILKLDIIRVGTMYDISFAECNKIYNELFSLKVVWPCNAISGVSMLISKYETKPKNLKERRWRISYLLSTRFCGWVFHNFSAPSLNFWLFSTIVIYKRWTICFNQKSNSCWNRQFYALKNSLRTANDFSSVQCAI